MCKIWVLNIVENVIIVCLWVNQSTKIVLSKTKLHDKTQCQVILKTTLIVCILYQLLNLIKGFPQKQSRALRQSQGPFANLSITGLHSFSWRCSPSLQCALWCLSIAPWTFALFSAPFRIKPQSSFYSSHLPLRSTHHNRPYQKNYQSRAC
jgi:hypothetical protein